MTISAQQKFELATIAGQNIAHIKREQAALSIRGLSVSYGDSPVLFSVDVDFPKEQMCAIIGPNGAGKSTLIKAVLDIIPKLSGDVILHGQKISKKNKSIAYVPQRASIDWDFPVTVKDVVEMGLYQKVGLLGRLSTKAHQAKVCECLDHVGMVDFMDRQIGQLSGGQQQRVFLARALAQDLEVYLLDEPFAGVDAATEKAIVQVLQSLKQKKKTVIAVHHDLASVEQYFDHITLLNTRLIASGQTDETFTSENLHHAYGGALSLTQLDGYKQPS